MTTKRLFLAIPLSADFSEYLIAIGQNIKLPEKAIPIENLHITVHFFGNIKVEDIPELCKTIEEVVYTIQVIELEFDGLKHQSRNSMIWAIFKKSDPLRDLVRGLRTKLKVNQTRFFAHVTMARLKGKNNVELPSKLKKHKVMVNSLELWESVQNENGSVYHVLCRFPLKNN